MEDRVVWDVHITLNSIFVAVVSLPLVGVFIVLSYQLIQNVESYIAVLGILSGPAYMTISRFFDRWNAESEAYVEAQRSTNKTTNDLRRRGLPTELAHSEEE